MSWQWIEVSNVGVKIPELSKDAADRPKPGTRPPIQDERLTQARYAGRFAWICLVVGVLMAVGTGLAAFLLGWSIVLAGFVSGVVVCSKTAAARVPNPGSLVSSTIACFLICTLSAKIVVFYLIFRDEARRPADAASFFAFVAGIAAVILSLLLIPFLFRSKRSHLLYGCVWIGLTVVLLASIVQSYLAL